RPTIVLLQGAFQLPEVYHAFVKLIEAHGFPVTQAPYPSLNQADLDFISKDLNDDAASAEACIRTLVEEEGKTVVVVMHSYGGLVGAEAVSEALTLKHRKARGLPGGVAHFFFLAAFVMDKGQSVAKTVGPSPDHDIVDGRFIMRDPLAKMYNDVARVEAQYWAARVISQSAAVMDTQMEICAWKYVPSTYVVCTKDEAVRPAVQEMFAGLAGSAVMRVVGGHSAFLSKAEEVVGLVGEVASQSF
ncbi:uncharacterized protein N0V89_001667, partial [Didymosphaeria variabile]